MNTSHRERALVVEEQLPESWNDTYAAYPCDATVADLFDSVAVENPNSIALVSGSRHVTYAELREQVNRLSRYLAARGVGPGSLVGVCVERSIDMCAALIAVLQAGGAYVPLDPAYPRARIELVLQDAGIDVLLTHQSLVHLSSGFIGRRVVLDAEREAIAAEDASPIHDAATPQGPAYVIYTSGSTGIPKGVVVSNRNLVNFLWSMRREPGLTAQDIVPAITTISFDIAGLEILLPLVIGARVVVLDRAVASDGRLLGEALAASGATLLQATPATWRLLLDAGWQGSPALKALTGGEAMPRELADRLLPRVGSLWNMYGPTETTVWSACGRIEAGEAISIGRPIANTQLYVLDEQLREVPLGDEGEIFIGGDGVAAGYLNRPELSAQRFVADPFSSLPGRRIYRTGDLGRRQPDGTILFAGRADHQVKIRGYRIELGEIEEVLARHPRVSQAVVLAVEDRPGEKRLVAYFTTDDASGLSSQEARAFIRERLPEYMLPSAFVRVDAFPLTPNGKTDRKALAAIDVPPPDSRAVVGARDPVERALVEIWEEALGVSPVGIHDDFFDLGGHSLIAVRIFAQIARRLGRNLPLATLVGAPTIAQLAATVREDHEATWNTLVTMQPNGDGRPLFIVHGGGGTVLFMRDLATQLGSERPVYGLQSEGLDGRRATRTSVKAMATHYLAAIRSVQPHGPYLLAGYCYGGIVAFEMARQLEADGERAALVALLNAPNRAVPAAAIEAVASRSGRRSAARRHWRALARLGPGGKTGYVAEIVRQGVRWRRAALSDLRRDIHQGLRRLACAAFLSAGRSVPQSLRDAYVLSVTTKAEQEYRPERFGGRVVVFRGRGLYSDPTLGWGSFCQRIDTHEIGGLHRFRRQIMQQPAVRDLAVQLARELEQAERAECRSCADAQHTR